jgi:hypothetical protein
LALTTDPLNIGDQPGQSGTYHFTDGDIDDVRIYGHGLSPREITMLYNTDSVGDGVANWWRLQYFGTSSSTDSTSCAACDYDGTGQNNLFKFVTGLNPTDSSQVFTLQIAPVPNQPGQMNLTFNPVAAGRTYTMQYGTGSASGPFNALAGFSGPQTNGSQVTITDTNATLTNEFYKLHISLP